FRLGHSSLAGGDFCLGALDRVFHCRFEIRQVCLSRVDGRLGGLLLSNRGVEILFSDGLFFCEWSETLHVLISLDEHCLCFGQLSLCLENVGSLLCLRQV